MGGRRGVGENRCARHRAGGLRAADRAAGGADIDVLQRFGALPELGRDLHHHMVLVEVLVDGRDLALAEGIVERVVDLADVDAEARRGRAVDVQLHLQPLVFLIGADVFEFGDVLQRVGDLGRPFAQFIQRVGLDRVLELREALPSARTNVLTAEQRQARTRHLVEFGAQIVHHLIGGELAFAKRLQLRIDETRIGGAAAAPSSAAGEADDVFDVGIAFDDVHELGEFLLHRLERDRLVGADAAHQGAGILLREEAFGDREPEIEIDADCDDENEDDRAGHSQRPAQRAFIGRLHIFENTARGPREAVFAFLIGRGGEIGAHHRRGGERDHQ